ncbi:Glypican domain containing protein [Aphelenchoides besseyi]|nr:Glypican domain containing protein [Aphelenchoides besseyi]
MFSTTYGHFYSNNAKIFNDFFDELDEQFAVDDQPRSAVKTALGSLFRKIFITEFSLLNPMRQVSDTERHCMTRIQTHMRPFGQIPTKIATQLDRSFATWKSVVNTLEKTSILLINVADRLQLSSECTGALVRLRECHVCSGVSVETRPCLGFCLNVLRGCFAEVAELESQWEELIDALQLLAPRLKGASNPYLSMAPIPVQISEAIMLFQEKGDALSSRIIFQCFEPIFRAKRSTDETKVDKPFIVPDGETAAKVLGEYLDAEYHKADLVKKDVLLLSDRLSRMRGAWRALPAAICSDGQVAAPTGEGCWNGKQVASYRRPLAANGIRGQKKNPEFSDLKLSRETFIEERIKLMAMARHLDFVYDGRVSRRIESPMIEGSALEDLGGPDDEETLEGSAYNRDDEDQQAESEVLGDLLDIRLLEQKRGNFSPPTRRNNWTIVLSVGAFLLFRF